MIELNNDEKRNFIECIGRRYRIQSPSGTITEVESTKPLSKYLNDKLLEEDEGINSFFADHKILSIRQLMTAPQQPLPRIVVGPKGGKFIQEQRLNHLKQMEGEFSREDFQKYLKDKFGYELNSWLWYGDIKIAKRQGIIEDLGKIHHRGPRKYKIKEEAKGSELKGNYLSKQLLEGKKVILGTIK